MSLSTLSSTELSQLIQLVKDKEALEAKLKSIQGAIEALASGKKVQVDQPARRSTRRGRRRASLKDAILKVLQGAGEEGLAVKELAAKIKANPGSVSVWFYTTGKKIKAVKKVGVARFAYLK